MGYLPPPNPDLIGTNYGSLRDVDPKLHRRLTKRAHDDWNDPFVHMDRPAPHDFGVQELGAGSLPAVSTQALGYILVILVLVLPVAIAWAIGALR